MSTTRPTAPIATETSGWIGEPVTRREDERLLRGVGRFVDDFEAPDMLHAAILRSPFAHARIRSIDATEALELDGVLGVLTGQEIRSRTDPLTVLRPLRNAVELGFHAMATDRALFEGHAVASVVAADRYIAEDALEKIIVDFELLPAVVDAQSALESDAPLLYDHLDSNLLADGTLGGGDAPDVIAGAHVRVGGEFRINRVSGLPMEGRAVIAATVAGLPELVVHNSTQTPHLTRMQLAWALRLPESHIRIIAPDVGGGFGLKLGIYPEDVIVALHAIDLGRPVKWIEDRLEHFRTSTHARESIHVAEIGATENGKLLGIRDDYTVDAGAYNSPFGPPVLTSLMLPGPYRVSHVEAHQRAVLTNKTPVGAYRGYGQPESNLVREVLLDELARQLGEDPIELRRRNLLHPDELPWTSATGAVYDSGDYPRALDAALDAIDYRGFAERQDRLRSEGRHVGVGVACFAEMTGYPGSAFLRRQGAAFGEFESVTLRMDRAGGCELYTGVPSFGQGTETAFAQICADRLGISPEQVMVRAGDTAGTPYNVGSFASRTTIAGAGAVNAAALEVKDKAIRLAAHLLGVAVDQLELIDGVVQGRTDPSVSITLAEVAKEAYLGQDLPDGEHPGLEATAYFDPPENTFSYGTAAAQVEVDPATGEFEIQRFILVHDCGRMVNPLLVEGQIHGGLAQGFGAAFFESLEYDADTGQLVTGTMIDYLMPTAADLPRFELHHIEVPSTVTPFGIRGVGETGTIPPAAAVINAIAGAFPDLPLSIRALPVTPETVLRAIQRAQEGHAA